MRVTRMLLVIALSSFCFFTELAPVDAQRVTERDRRRVTRDFFSRKNEFRSPNNRGDGDRQTPDRPKTVTYRSIDGSGNNLAHPTWGTTGINLIRRVPAEYSDGEYVPARIGEISARRISNYISAQEESILNSRNLTDMVWQWGQFLDHDITLTETATPAESWPINVTKNDEFFDPFALGGQTISFFRSEYNHLTGEDTGRPRQQTNGITAWIDGSNVYGSDATTAANLREMRRGLMKVSDGNLLPIAESGFFEAGDVRANEQVGLTAMHTLFIREHNRIARGIYQRNSSLSDEVIYQEARREVVGIMQSITYNEFLPALLGRHGPRPYRGYRAGVNPGISNVFSTAAYRFGHSMLSSEILRVNNVGRDLDGGPLALRDAFFNPSWIKTDGIEPYLKGLTIQQAQEVDAKIIDDVRNFLFGAPGAGGFDLVSLNIQRGRDHGIADYNRIRTTIGLPRVTKYAEISSDVAVQAGLALSYDGVSQIDPWIGLLSEDHLPGASMGITAARLLREQFEKLRDGDRYWYERDLSGDRLRRIQNTRLAEVIQRNSRVRNLQRNVFFIPSAQP